MNSREAFYHVTKNRPPSPLLVRAVALLAEKRWALDLGCGAGRDTRFLLAQGFEVTAVDTDALARAYLQELAHPALQVVHASFEAFFSPPSHHPYDLINAAFSLPFQSAEALGTVLRAIPRALRPGGLFTGQFFGVNDSWNVPNRQRPMTFVTREQAENLLRELSIVEFAEEDRDGTTADGLLKHWHVFHIIAQRSMDQSSEESAK